MLTAIVSSVVATFLSCTATLDEGDLVYKAELPQNAATGLPESAQVWQMTPSDGSWTLVASYKVFDDITPQTPTDVEYHYQFHAEGAKPGELSLAIWKGGFTNETTAQMVVYGDADAPALGTMTCQEKESAR